MGKISKFLDQELKREPRFGLLFLMLILALAVPSFLPSGTAFQLAVQILISAILLVGLTSVSQGKRLLMIGILVVLPAIALNWLARLVDHNLLIASNVLAIAFLLYLAILILSYLNHAKRADVNTIYGAICVFMLLGFIWGLIFFVFEVVDPQALTHSGARVYDDVGDLLEATSSSFYLSFVTLTTLGYGDITPVSNPARTLAIIEAIVGQLFLIVMISRLVGLNVAHSMRESEQRAARAAVAHASENAEAAPDSGKKTGAKGRGSGKG